MDLISLTISIAALVISVLSIYINHSLSKKRDFTNKKKEIKISYLIEAWKDIEKVSNRKKGLNETIVKLEEAFAIIQLLGSKEQIEIAKNIAYSIAKDKVVSTEELLNLLRNNLREELSLERIDERTIFLRF